MLDEDSWVVPAEWWGRAEAFRGMGGLRPPEPDPRRTTALRALLTQRHSQLSEILRHTQAQGFQAVAAAMEDYLGDPRAANPLGAAAVAVVVQRNVLGCCVASSTHDDHLKRDGILDGLVDEWLAHSTAFAAEAAVLAAGLTVAAGGTSERSGKAVRPCAADAAGGTWADRVLHRVRKEIAWADDSEYAAVVARLSMLRTTPGARWTRLATSYLAPGQQDWVDDDLWMGGGPRDSWAVGMLAGSLTSLPQFTRYLELTERRSPYSGWGHAQLFSLLVRIGPAAARYAVAELSHAHHTHAATVRLLSQVLAHIPTDEAFEGLLAYSHYHNYSEPALAQAARRYPRRAMRLLSAYAARSASGPGVRAFLRHAATYPSLLAEPGLAHPDAVHLFASSGVASHPAEAGSRTAAAQSARVPIGWDPDTAVAIARLAAAFDWSWRESDLERFCEAAGWRISDRDRRWGATLETTLRIARPRAMVTIDDGVHTRDHFQDIDPGPLLNDLLAWQPEPDPQPLRRFGVLVTDVGDTDDAMTAQVANLADMHAELAARLTAELGPATRHQRGGYPEIGWELPNVVINLAFSDRSGTLELLCPAEQEKSDRIERYERDYDEDYEDLEYARFPALAHGRLAAQRSGRAVLRGLRRIPPRTRRIVSTGGLPWPEFTAALTELLFRLPVQTDLILDAGGERSVRLRIGPGEGELLCAIAGNHRLPARHQLPEDAKAWLAHRGWLGADGLDWVRTIPLPAPYVAFECAAHEITTALAEFLHVRRPAALTVYAFGDSDSTELAALRLDVRVRNTFPRLP